MLRYIAAMVTVGYILQPISARRIVDLTHALDENAIVWPMDSLGIPKNKTDYQRHTLLSQYYPSGLWIDAGSVEFYEHMGTHMDAPLHTGGPGRHALHEIPPDQLVGPGVVVDVRKQAEENPDYTVSVQDLQEYEKKYGTIPRGSIVIMNSGWAEKYPNANFVFGTDDVNNASTFHFPGFSLDACKMLLNERQVSVVGVDTPSVDPAKPGPFYCHRYLQPNNIPLLEYVANLDGIPASGTTMFIGAIKTRGSSGGPTRIFAVIEDKDTDTSRAATEHRGPIFAALFSVVLCLLTRSA